MNPHRIIPIWKIDKVIVFDLAQTEIEAHLKFYFKMINISLVAFLVSVIVTFSLFIASSESILSLMLGLTTVAAIIVLNFNIGWARIELSRVVEALLFIGENVKKWRFIYVERDSVVLSNQRPLGFYFSTKRFLQFSSEE